MQKEKRLQIRMSEEDFARLEAYANRKDISMAQVLREHIKKLPAKISLLTHTPAIAYPLRIVPSSGGIRSRASLSIPTPFH
jgi:hypothetical protein